MGKTYKVIKSSKLSKPYDGRYIVVDISTNKILDDAQGYGYKSIKRAYSAYAYKTRTPESIKKSEETKKIVKTWVKGHKEFCEKLEDDQFCIMKGSYAPNDKFDVKWVKEAFKDADFQDLPFTISEFLKYW